MTASQSLLSRYKIEIIAVILLVVLFSVVLPYLRQSATPSAQLMTAPPCDLQQQRCSAQLDNMVITLALAPTPLVSQQPITVQAELQGFPEQRTVRLVLEGVDMYMGEIQTKLSAETTQPDILTGQTALALCLTGEMTWRATLYIETADNLYAAYFDFSAR